MKKLSKKQFIEKINQWKGLDVMFTNIHKDIKGIEFEINHLLGYTPKEFKERIVVAGWINKPNLVVVEKSNHLLLNDSRMDFGDSYHYDDKYEILFVSYDNQTTAYTRKE